MKISKILGRVREPAVTLAIALVVFLGPNAGSTVAQELHLDPAKVAGPDACGECHKSSVSVWKDTHHATTFRDLPRKKEAKEIAKKMGIRRMKAESACLSCHFTSADAGGKIKPIAGITCESCHGAGKDWIKTHSDYGGKGVTMKTETAEHKKERYAKSEAAGMIRPVRLYDVAANCYGCHTVPNEKLVNVGGHPAGSSFDLVAWTQGEVRHNVWYSKANDEASAERKRMMYIVGKALDLEFALRGVAVATENAAYAVSMAKRAQSAALALQAISQKIKAPEIDAIMAVAGSINLSLGQGKALNAAADKVKAAAKGLADNYDGSKFAAVDSLLPKPGDYKGKAAP